MSRPERCVIGDANSGAVNVSAGITQAGKITNIAATTTTTVLSGGSLGISRHGERPAHGEQRRNSSAGHEPRRHQQWKCHLCQRRDLRGRDRRDDAGQLPTQHDQLNVTGTVTLGGATLTPPAAFGGFTPTAGQTFVIINNDSTDAVSGTFNGLPEGATIPQLPRHRQLHRDDHLRRRNDSNDVVLTSTAVPTPTPTPTATRRHYGLRLLRP